MTPCLKNFEKCQQTPWRTKNLQCYLPTGISQSGKVIGNYKARPSNIYNFSVAFTIYEKAEHNVKLPGKPVFLFFSETIAVTLTA